MAKIINLWEECARRTGYKHPVFVPHEPSYPPQEPEDPKWQEDIEPEKDIAENALMPPLEEQEEFFEYGETMNGIDLVCDAFKHIYDTVPTLNKEIKCLGHYVNSTLLERINQLSEIVLKLQEKVYMLEGEK